MTSWRVTNKFRLFCLVMLSLLTSIATGAPVAMWTVDDLLGMFVQAGIVAFGFLQCPGDRVTGRG